MNGSTARLTLGLALFVMSDLLLAGGPTLTINTPTSPPEWALLERELLRASSNACVEFFERYFDERGYVRCVERWGGDDGPDDAIENCNDWPHLHALGAPDKILEMYKKAWEGHLRQFTEARTTEVPFARDGMYYKEFPVMFDWQHNAEGLGVFNLQGLSDPEDLLYGQRVRRFAGFYMNEDPGAPNYDPKHKIIRSLFNGSRGPLLRKATALDWTGDPIEVENRFKLVHGERSYEEMLAHFKDYTDIVGDHPLNLLSTTLALNAYMLTHEQKYRDWLLQYVDAWLARMKTNGNLIPSNIGLDGTVGGECGGKWYGGTYGWSFSPIVPQTGQVEHRNRIHRAFVGFMNAYLLTADDGYLDAWRKQADTMNGQARTIDGKLSTPTMFGDKGWYGFRPGKCEENALEIYYLSMRPADRQRISTNAWLDFLEGKNSAYPVEVLRRDLNEVRKRVQEMRRDITTPDTRLADDPMDYNPAVVSALIQLMQGGLHVTRKASVLHARVRYFDPVHRRAGMPEEVAALVETMSDSEVGLFLVNVSQVQARELWIQSGAYGEHEFQSVRLGEEETPVGDSIVRVRLEPGCGARLRLKMKRFAKAPTLSFPWASD